MGRQASTEFKSNTLEYYKNYYHKHNENITCACGHSLKKFAIYRHLKSKKHIAYLEISLLKNEIEALKNPNL